MSLEVKNIAKGWQGSFNGDLTHEQQNILQGEDLATGTMMSTQAFHVML